MVKKAQKKSTTTAASKTKKKTTTTKSSKSTTTKSITPKSKSKPSTAKTAIKNLKINEPLTKTQQIALVSNQLDLDKKTVSAVIECFESMIAAHLTGPGQMTFAGLMKVIAVRKPATKARKGVNPFTGEPTIFKAKPARNIVKIKPLKKVKDLVA